METWQIILAIIIVGLSIVMPIYYSYKKKKLERELKENSWLVIPADSTVIFNTECTQRASAAALSIGLNLDMLALDSGHA